MTIIGKKPEISYSKKIACELLSLDKLLAMSDEGETWGELSHTAEFCKTFVPSVCSWVVDKKRDMSVKQEDKVHQIYQRFFAQDWIIDGMEWQCFIDDERISHVK